MAEKILIAIVTCHRFAGRVEAVRNTWLKEMNNLEYRFFYGGHGGRQPLEDEVFLGVDDSYQELSHKTQAIMKWALDHGYTTVLKCDDDVFIFPERLVNVVPRSMYEGRLNFSNKNLVLNGWCSGFAYWLRGKALELVANTPPMHKAEDMSVGMILAKNSIYPTLQKGFMVMSIITPPLWKNYKDQLIAACEFKDSMMQEFHKAMRVADYQPTPSLTGPINPRTGKRTMRFGEVLRRRKRFNR